MLKIDSKARFTTRVESYRKFRPGYPAAVVEVLARECGLSADDTVADVAAGTGILTELFLTEGYPVVAVEPNAAMREACAALEASYPKLRCIEGSAEEMGLAEDSVALITVAQAMHWFDLGRTRQEFVRVLRPGGCCAVIYNHRRMEGDAFHDDYEQILREFGSDYAAVQGKHLGPEKIAGFFAPSPSNTASFANHQDFTLEGLMGRVLSSSYMPQPGDERYPEMESAVEELFAQHQQDGHVRMEYETVVCWGQL
jgi:ubiquinone/menaquinone biosynthesis C-methylase UbiE